MIATLLISWGAWAYTTDNCWTRPGGYVQVAANVAYQNGTSPQKLDIYVPADAGAPYKTVIVVHGGCFQWGGKGSLDVTKQVTRLTNAGFAVISVDYRLADPKNGKNLFPASLEDVQDATRWVRANGDRYHLKTDQLIAFGYSAGGTLAAYLGTRVMTGSANKADSKAVNDPILSARVSGVVDLFGRTDFEHGRPNEKHSDDGRDCGEEYLGVNRAAQYEKQFAMASVLNGVDSNSARFLIMHGTDDKDVSVEHSELLYAKLEQTAPTRAQARKTQFFKIPGATHMFPRAGDMDEAWKKICPFLSDVLGEPAPVRTAAN